MAGRLPKPGSDAGNWGTILNDFLEVAHNATGTLRPSAITAAGGVQVGGDIGGTAASPSIAKIQGTAVHIANPAGNHVLIYDASTGRWINRPLLDTDVTNLAGKSKLALAIAVAL